MTIPRTNRPDVRARRPGLCAPIGTRVGTPIPPRLPGLPDAGLPRSLPCVIAGRAAVIDRDHLRDRLLPCSGGDRLPACRRCRLARHGVRRLRIDVPRPTVAARPAQSLHAGHGMALTRRGRDNVVKKAILKHAPIGPHGRAALDAMTANQGRHTGPPARAAIRRPGPGRTAPARSPDHLG